MKAWRRLLQRHTAHAAFSANFREKLPHNCDHGKSVEKCGTLPCYDQLCTTFPLAVNGKPKVQTIHKGVPANTNKKTPNNRLEDPQYAHINLISFQYPMNICRTYPSEMAALRALQSCIPRCPFFFFFLCPCLSSHARLCSSS